MAPIPMTFFYTYPVS